MLLMDCIHQLVLQLVELLVVLLVVLQVVLLVVLLAVLMAVLLAVLMAVLLVVLLAVQLVEQLAELGFDRCCMLVRLRNNDKFRFHHSIHIHLPNLRPCIEHLDHKRGLAELGLGVVQAFVAEAVQAFEVVLAFAVGFVVEELEHLLAFVVE